MFHKLIFTEFFYFYVLIKYVQLKLNLNILTKLCMNRYPEEFADEVLLEEWLSQPGDALVACMRRLQGDIMILGVGGKMGPTLARMAKRACDRAGIKRKVTGVSQFRTPGMQKQLEEQGIETIAGDLLDPGFIARLPKAPLVYYMAGMKFGTGSNPALTWAMNAHVPAMVAGHFRDSHIVAFSTGCVYPLVDAASGGSKESDPPLPVGEYAQSCLGRERMFEYGNTVHHNPVVLIRLNYAVELRYGVLVDIARKVQNGHPVDLTMGFFNAIWQGDANDMILRSIELASSPPRILNVTGPELLTVREIALKFGSLLGKDVTFTGSESPTALLSNSHEAFRRLGQPKVLTNQVIHWIAAWLKQGGRLLDKPTHFEVRDGNY
jgi:nucleoside-diphosphate-sugar epimerase